ncbi:hypothetical protein C8R47DRAFT_1068133 [Mycena vitilis]|nr:hypothetical protein C8R47DRAFT_1068133 [Mycena vitilis]
MYPAVETAPVGIIRHRQPVVAKPRAQWNPPVVRLGVGHHYPIEIHSIPVAPTQASTSTGIHRPPADSHRIMAEAAGVWTCWVERRVARLAKLIYGIMICADNPKWESHYEERRNAMNYAKRGKREKIRRAFGFLWLRLAVLEPTWYRVQLVYASRTAADAIVPYAGDDVLCDFRRPLTGTKASEKLSQRSSKASGRGDKMDISLCCIRRARKCGLQAANSSTFAVKRVLSKQLDHHGLGHLVGVHQGEVINERQLHNLLTAPLEYFGHSYGDDAGVTRHRLNISGDLQNLKDVFWGTKYALISSNFSEISRI